MSPNHPDQVKWRIRINSDYDGYSEIVDGHGDQVCVFKSHDIPARKRAEFIVSCVNMQDELLEVVKDCINMHKSEWSTSERDQYIIDMSYLKARVEKLIEIRDQKTR